MRLACKFEQLDDDTRNYLHDVRSRQGKGTPGIFIHTGTMRPWLAFLIGPTVAFVLLSISFASTKDAWAIAMLQTAGLVIGGWSLMYAFRRWFAGRSKTYGRKFLFFDSLHAYTVEGETVTITGLKNVEAVTALPGAPRVSFEFRGDREEVVAVPSAKDANLVADYYEAMGDLEKAKSGVWDQATPAEIGAAAKQWIEEDAKPRDVSDVRLDLDEIPEPKKEYKAGFGFLPILLILAGGGVLYFALFAINRPMQDNLAFERAKEQGAPGLRGYLLDERNVRNRDEAKQLLAAAYDPVIAKLEGPPKAVNQKARDGMITLVNSLRTADSPVVSLDVTEAANGVELNAQLAEARAKKLRTDLADALARGVDPKLIAFAAPAEGAKAHITVKYQFVREKDKLVVGNDGGYVAEIELEIRTDIAAEPIGKHKWVEAINFPTGLFSYDFDTKGAEGVKLALCRDLVGGYTPAPPPVIETVDDF